MNKQQGVPKTDEERKAMHKKLHGDEKLPLRGTGLKQEIFFTSGMGQNIWVMEEGKTYVKSPSEAPKGSAVKRGPKGGYYYDEPSGKGTSRDVISEPSVGDRAQSNKKTDFFDKTGWKKDVGNLKYGKSDMGEDEANDYANEMDAKGYKTKVINGSSDDYADYAVYYEDPEYTKKYVDTGEDPKHIYTKKQAPSPTQGQGGGEEPTTSPEFENKMKDEDYNKVYKVKLAKAETDKEWGKKALKDKKWMDEASDYSKEVAQKYATQSVEESAEKTTDYIKHRAFAMGKVWGSPSPIAPDKRAEWEEITGKKIK